MEMGQNYLELCHFPPLYPLYLWHFTCNQMLVNVFLTSPKCLKLLVAGAAPLGEFMTEALSHPRRRLVCRIYCGILTDANERKMMLLHWWKVWTHYYGSVVAWSVNAALQLASERRCGHDLRPAVVVVVLDTWNIPFCYRFGLFYSCRKWISGDVKCSINRKDLFVFTLVGRRIFRIPGICVPDILF